MKNFLLLSDALFSVNSRIAQERWYPPLLKLISEKAARKVLAWFDRRSQKNFNRLMTEADHLRLDGIIGVGNYTIGTNEKGMIDEDCEKQFHQFMWIMWQKFLRWNRSAKKCFAPGNHDVGYCYKVHGVKVGTERGGPSTKSLESFKRLFDSPLYGMVDFEACNVLYISSVLIRNKLSDDFKVASEALEQEAFFNVALDHYSSSKPLFIVVHDPKALWFSRDIISIMYFNREKIAGIIHGHMHSTLLQTIVYLCDKKYRLLCKDFKTILALEPGGFFGIGGGFNVLLVEDDGTWSVETKKL